MKCLNRQAELRDNAFCMADGKALQTELVFAECNYANPPEAEVCLQCGQLLAARTVVDHPYMVMIYDSGYHGGQPHMVLPLLPGGNVEGLIEKAPAHKLPSGKVTEIALAVCKGLGFTYGNDIIYHGLKPGPPLAGQRAHTMLWAPERGKRVTFGALYLIM